MYTTLMLMRSSLNPILTATPTLDWSSKKVYNCAVYKENGSYRMLFRAIGDDWISRFGLAESTDGTTFTVHPSPVMSPFYPWEELGCEDPRIVKINDIYWVTYTAYDGETARVALCLSADLHNWHDRKLLFPDWHQQQRENLPPDWSKAAAIFSRQINDRYYLFFGDSHIWPAVSDNLTDWEPSTTPVLSARDNHFDSAYVEMGPPPILTDRGWLVLYHGVNSFDNQRVYSLGAALFDTDDPLKLLWRSDSPILEPNEPYEVLGMIDIVDGGFDTLKTIALTDLERMAHEHRLPKAIFCCGAILEDDELRLYYSGGDTVICTALIDLESVFNS